jgi:hypothetical protein
MVVSIDFWIIFAHIDIVIVISLGDLAIGNDFLWVRFVELANKKPQAGCESK